MYLAATKKQKVTPSLILAGKCTMMTIDTYSQLLLAIATEQPDSWTAESRQLLLKHQPSPTPIAFVITLFVTIAANQIPISREGTERLMDTLLENPAFTPLLTDPTIHQTQVAAAIDLPTRTVAFQTFWTHIVLPAWDQHVELYRMMAATEDTR